MTTQTVRLCVRCGRKPRHPDLYVCPSCHESPALRTEMREASRRRRDYRAQRTYLLAHGWAGGWPAWPRDDRTAG